MSIQPLILLITLLSTVACQNEHTPVLVKKHESESAGINYKKSRSSTQEILNSSNTKLRRIDLGPNETYIIKNEGAGLFYALSDCDLSWSENESKQGQLSLEESRVHFHIPGKHRIHNIARKSCSFLLFECLNSSEKRCENLDEIHELEGSFAEVLFKNQYYQVSKVRLEPGIEIPKHETHNRIIYALSTYQIEHNKNSTEKLESGDIYCTQDCTGQLANVGHTRAEWLEVHLK